jgi:cell shape-determining protein MreC
MEMLKEALPVVIYLLLIVLLVVLIVFFIKTIYTVNKVNKIVDDVEGKVQSLNGAFAIIDGLTDKISSLGDFLVNIINEKVLKLFSKKRKTKNNEEEYDMEEEDYE